MRKFRITKQRGLFGSDEKITDRNRTNTIEINADSYAELYDDVLITDDNLEYAKKYLNAEYKVGDIHKSPIKSISFIKDEYEIENINILADPYYKLEEYINDEWILVSKHKCGSHK